MKYKYARLTDKEVLQIEERELPAVNGAMMIRVTNVGICGSDVHMWEKGDQPAYKGMVMGHEYSGVVVDPGFSGLKKGDRVAGYTQNSKNEACGLCEDCLKGDFDNCKKRKVKVAIGCDLDRPGAYSEYLCWFPSAFFKLPDNVTNEEAALLEPASVGLHAVKLSEIKPGMNVVVLGAGIIGLCVAEWARVKGAANVTITDISQEKLDTIRALNAADDYIKADDPKLEEKILEKFPDGVDIVYDAVANQITVNQSLRLLKRGGTLLMVGVPQKSLEFDSREVVLRQKRIQGSKGHVPEEFQSVLDSLAAGELNLKKYVTAKYPLSDIQEAFKVAKAGGKNIKVVIEP